MTRAPRHRRYIGRRTLVVLRPIYRYSYPRDAYVLRAVGRRFGPVLAVDRRFTRDDPPGGLERRGAHQGV
jgi:hypothetical protein